ncbi:toxin-activating lysine-acyltransferase [Ensifer sp. ENS09]|uniref:toxin-activating lysine-acyltransferase n=1 Tax=Ensifer sp. ENS09 TaxID=2769263 RepID=UPI0017876AB2|nr:toxin-activating lysine-acyltransferase [Ensifer sp. ENS09]MBD9653135.1 toxin-activating lysine-acyltransferase [Ensifer sp. ENS09]
MTTTDNTTTDPTTFNVFEALGMVVAIAMESHYSDWSISEVERYIVPALKSGQYKLYVNDHVGPAAFVTWAFLNDECHEAMLAHGRNPPADHWQSGRHLWVMDIVAPYGDAKRVVRDLQRNLFPQMHGHSIRRDPSGNIIRVARWRNALAGDRAGFC